MNQPTDIVSKFGKQGYRLTPQRMMILSAIESSEDHISAEEIYSQIVAKYPYVNISTVYRTLDLLEGFQLVACVDPGDGQRLYELEGVHVPHLYLVCRSCGKVMAVELEPAPPLAAYLRVEHGFEADLDHLPIPGRCPACLGAHGGAES